MSYDTDIQTTITTVSPSFFYCDKEWLVTLPGYAIQDTYDTKTEAYRACDDTWSTETHPIDTAERAWIETMGEPLYGNGSLIEYHDLRRWVLTSSDGRTTMGVRQDGTMHTFTGTNPHTILHRARMFATQPPLMWLPADEYRTHRHDKPVMIPSLTAECTLCAWNACMKEWRDLYGRRTLDSNGRVVISFGDRVIPERFDRSVPERFEPISQDEPFTGVSFPYAAHGVISRYMKTTSEEPPAEKIISVRNRVQKRYAR